MASIFGRSVIVPLVNKSGGGVIAGDVVIIDTGNDGAFTTTTSAGYTGGVGVAQETIASNATGRVLLEGYAALVNVNASVTRGQYGTTHTVAKQATGTASRGAGTFVQWLTGGTTPTGRVFSPDLAAAAGNVAVDAIWDAKGDLAAGTGADTASKLTVGANGKALIAASGQTTGLQWQYPPGYEFDYVEITSPVTITGASEGSETTCITGSSVSYDGSTVIEIHFSAPRVDLGGAGLATVFMLYDGATVLGRIATPIGAGSQTVNGYRRLTPSNASHQYIIKAWRSTTNSTLQAGAGGSGNDIPAFLRITKAA